MMKYLVQYLNQIKIIDFFNHLKEKINKNEYNTICQPISDQHQIYLNYIQRLTVSLQTSMKMYCYKQGDCKDRDSFNSTNLVRLKQQNTIVLVAFLGIFQICLSFYWFYFTYRLKTNKLKLSFYQLEMIMTKKVKGPGLSHKEKKNAKKGVKQDGVIEDQKSVNNNDDGVDLEMKKIGPVVNDVDQLFSISSSTNNNHDDEANPKAQKIKEQQIKEQLAKSKLQQKNNMRESTDFEINLRRQSLQDLENIENNGHNMSFSIKNDNNNFNNFNNFNDNLSYINENNMSFNLDTQNVQRDDNTVLPFQPTQTGFYENPELTNTFYNSYTQENIQNNENDISIQDM